MRRLSLPILGVLLSISAADVGRAQELAVGFRGGLDITSADFEGSLLESTSSRTGWSGGLVLSALITRTVELQTGGWISKKGFDGVDSSGGGTTEVDQTYFEIPMLIGVRIPGKISPHLLAGPVLGLELSCNLTAPNFPNGVNCDDPIDAPRTKGADFGILFGAGVEVSVGRVSLLADALYNLGLTDISEFSVGGQISSIKSRAFYLSFGVLWPIGGTRGPRGTEPQP